MVICKNTAAKLTKNIVALRLQNSYVFVEVSASDFETNALGLTLTETLRFHQEGHPELNCYSAPIKSSSKIWWSGRQPCY